MKKTAWIPLFFDVGERPIRGKRKYLGKEPRKKNIEKIAKDLNIHNMNV